MRKRPRVLQECLLITGRCRVPVEGEEYHYYYYYCVYFKLSLCLQVRFVVKLRITIIWAISYHVSNRLMLHLRL